MTLDLVHVPCTSCGQDDAEPLIASRDHFHGGTTLFHVVRCRHCALAYLDPRPRDGDLASLYSEEYGAYLGRASWLTRLAHNVPVSKRARWVAQHVPRGGSVLDVGCGDGRLLAHLAAKGFAVRGVELSAEGARQCREDQGLDVFHGSLMDARLPAASLDAITMIHAIEHAPDPAALLAECHRLLRPGGVLLIEIPHHDSLPARIFGSYWQGWHLPYHLYHFTTATLERFLVRAGFSPAGDASFLFDSQWGLSFGLMARSILSVKDPNARWLVPLRQLLKLVTLPLGYLFIHLMGVRSGIVQITARKPGAA